MVCRSLDCCHTRNLLSATRRVVVRVRALEDETTHDVAAVEVDTADVAQAVALVSRCRKSGIKLPPVLIVLDDPKRWAAVRPLLQLAKVAPDRLLIGAKVGTIYDGTGHRRILPPTRAGPWIDAKRVQTLLAPG